jgi:hypothetical protein
MNWEGITIADGTPEQMRFGIDGERILSFLEFGHS